MPRAIWINDAYVNLDFDIIPVGYKHHLDYVETDTGQITQFFAYRARAKRGEQEGWADDWGSNFALLVKNHQKMIIAEPEWNGGKIVEVGRMECCGRSLIIEIPKQVGRNIAIRQPSTRERSEWLPDGYADRNHLWNRSQARSDMIVREPSKEKR